MSRGAAGRLPRDRTEPPAPSPALAPHEVLETVLSALARNDEPAPDHGVAVVHAFASERMRRAIGDEAAFRRALHNSLYRPLVEAATLAAGALDRRGDSARARVTAGIGGHVEARFMIGLTRAEQGAGKDCWLLSGIVREGVDL